MDLIAQRLTEFMDPTAAQLVATCAHLSARLANAEAEIERLKGQLAGARAALDRQTVDADEVNRLKKRAAEAEAQAEALAETMLGHLDQQRDAEQFEQGADQEGEATENQEREHGDHEANEEPAGSLM